jgi:hypothetical protein
MAAGIKKIRFSRHLVFFEKLLFHKTCVLVTPNECKKKIETNRKFRVPRKQGAHFLGAWAQIQDSWVFSSSV